MRALWVVLLLGVSNVYAAPASFTVALSSPAYLLTPFMVQINNTNNPRAQGGTFTFAIDGASVQPLSVTPHANQAGGAFTFGTPAPIGPHRLTVQYSGDSAYDPSVTNFDFETEWIKGSSVSRPAADPPNPLPSQPVRLTSAVSLEGEPLAFGTVRFWEGNNVLASAASDGSKASAYVSLGVGPHSIYADFDPDGAFLSSVSATLELVVARRQTSISTPSIRGGERAGEPAVLSAVITPAAPGVLTFHNGPVQMGSAPIGPSGLAELSIGGFGGGSYAITARYAGSSEFEPSNSGVLSHRVAGQLQVQLFSNANPADPANSIVVTAILEGPPGPSTDPLGSVTLRSGSRVLGTAPSTALRTRTFVLAPGMLAPGEHTLIATYSGDSFFDESSSPPLLQRVSKWTTTPSVRVNLTQTAALHMSVTSPSGVVPGGSVRLTGGGQTLTLALTGGAAVLQDARAMLGRRVTAQYLGDDLHATSSVDHLMLAPVNGFSFSFGPLAPAEIVTVFGEAFGAQPQVRITPAGGSALTPSLYYASSTQTTVALPATLPDGPATLSIANATGQTHTAEVTVVRTAPGIATASSDGQGPPAAQVLRVRDGVSTLENAGPLAFNGGPLYLILYGTGFRYATSPVVCTAAGRTMTAAFAGPQGEFPGLDQINLPLDATLAGAGTVAMSCSADGRVSNAVLLQFP